MKSMRKIIHIDMDCFYAAVEMRDDPTLRGIPLAVGGRSTQRGVISTCNYEARAFGVRSAMSTARAFKLCPHLTLVSGRMEVYKQVSQKIRNIMEDYTSLIEPLSLDEAYLDVSDSRDCHGSATLIAQDIRRRISEELNLTASAGVAPLKFLAKVASDINKPNGQFVITPSEMQAFIDQLALEKIPGVGKVAIENLHNHGFYTGRDICDGDYRYLLKHFGRLGSSLWKKCHGQDDREVEVARERKSVGVERTLEKNIRTFDECWDLLENKLYPELKLRLSKGHAQRHIAKLGVKLKFSDFQVTTIENQSRELKLPMFHHLLSEIVERQGSREIRLIGISVTFTHLDQDRQLSFNEF
ncbi:DNA polymerase IV [Vibrio sp.]|nr:DNA polymerase IV [Vibrio sp.]